MKILKPGKVPELPPHPLRDAGPLRGTCRVCGCVAEVGFGETRPDLFGVGDDFLGRVVACPTPGCWAAIPVHEVEE